MNTPFPGMDPYLEHPALWPGVHTRLMVAIANQLGPRLLPRYVTSVEERVFLEGAGQQRSPDVWVQKARDDAGLASGGLAVATPVVLEVQELEVRERYVEVLDLYQDQRVVTVIELVSPTNKAAGPGRDSYVTKQRATLASNCHLVEVDLLRRGRHVLSVPELAARAVRPCEYLVCVNRAAARNRFELYPCRLRDRLPAIRVPLADPDPDAALDVQAAVEQVYREGGYAYRLRYQEPCEPPLAPDDQRWANERVAAYRAAHPELFAPPGGADGGAAAP